MLILNVNFRFTLDLLLNLKNLKVLLNLNLINKFNEFLMNKFKIIAKFCFYKKNFVKSNINI